MKLSMWTLLDNLEKYAPKAEIRTGERCLQTARLFSENMRFSTSTVYLMPMVTDRIIASNGNDILTLHSDDLNSVLNDVLDTFAVHYEWEQQMEQAIKQGCTAEELLRIFHEMTGYYFIFADATFFIRAFFGSDQIFESQPNLKPITEQGMMPLPILRRIHAMPQVRKENIPPYPMIIPDLGTAMICNLFTSGIHRGWLIVTSSKTNYTRGQIDLMQTLAEILSLWISRQQQTLERAQKPGIFYPLLKGDTESEVLVSDRLSAFGWQDSDAKYVHVFRPVSATAAPLSSLIGHLDSAYPDSFVLEFEDHPVMITDLAVCDIHTKKPLRNLLEIAGYAAGESPVFTDLSDLKRQYEAARLASQFTPEAPGAILRFQEAVLPYTFSLLKKYGASDLRHPALQILKEYDERRQTGLFPTLKLFLQLQGSFTETAEALHIHRSTLIYRIEKIQSMTGIDLSNADERFHLQLSFYLSEA